MKAGDVTFADAHKRKKGEGYVNISFLNMVLYIVHASTILEAKPISSIVHVQSLFCFIDTECHL